MSLVLTAFTRRGTTLALRLAALLGEGQVWTLEKFQTQGVSVYPSLSQWTKEQFAVKNDIIFVGATGIAVRAIAPYLQDKLTDPAILTVDELGQFVVPLLSGHVGGANELARRVAKVLDGTAVISTATDLNQQFAVDQWAASHGMTISNRQTAKAISAALLEGKPVGFSTDFPHAPLPAGVKEGDTLPAFAVTYREEQCFPPETLVLHPKVLAVGIGCKKDLPPHHVGEVVKAVFERSHLSLQSVAFLASITLKQDDLGIQALARQLQVPSHFYTPEQLSQVTGDFTPSNFVRSITGVDNVCERSAVLAAGGGKLLVHKTPEQGVTVAVALIDYIVQF